MATPRRPHGSRDTGPDPFGEVDLNPVSASACAQLTHGLLSQRSLTVAKAARLIRHHQIPGLERELCDAFLRFLDNPAKTDPGCSAKLAVLEALDYAEAMGEAIFRVAARTFQQEGAWGPPVDTAVGVRARAIAALARIGTRDFELLAAELLCDPEAPVRQAAGEALAYHGGSSGALALFKVRTGDPEPEVVLAAMGALLTLALERGIQELSPWLEGPDAERRELAALAFGQSRSEEALTVLLGACEGSVRPAERAVILRAMALHRSDRALEALLNVISVGRSGDAKVVIEALRGRSFERGLAQRVRDAATRSAHGELVAVAAAAFPDPTEG